MCSVCLCWTTARKTYKQAGLYTCAHQYQLIETSLDGGNPSKISPSKKICYKVLYRMEEKSTGSFLHDLYPAHYHIAHIYPCIQLITTYHIKSCSQVTLLFHVGIQIVRYQIARRMDHFHTLPPHQ